MADFVLIPGAWLGAWAWKRVVPLLEQRGHGAYPVTLTGMGERVHLAEGVGMETAIDDVRNVIKFNDLHNFVLVGHSFAGKVAAAVADRESENVQSIIYLDAFTPKKVRTPQAALDPASEFGPPPPGTNAIPLTKETVARIGPDVKGKDFELMMSKGTPWPVKLAADPISLSAKFDPIKSAYIFCRQSGDPVDDIVAGKWGKLEGPYRIMDTGHWPMITKPEELSEDLASLASAT